MDISGYSAAKIRNKKILGVIPKKWQKMTLKIINQVKAKGHSDKYEIGYTKKDGTAFCISVRAWLKKDREGKPVGMWVIVRDITERKEAEEALRKSEEEFRLAFENAKDAILWADTKTGLITNCNKAAEILLEKKRGEIVGRHQTMVHPRQKARYYVNMFKTHIKQKGAVDAEAEVITKSGKIKPVHITATVTLVGGKPIIQGIFRGITERKRAEEALRESEARYRGLLEYSGSAMIVIEKDKTISFVNKEFEKISGYSKEETIGRNFLDFIHKKHKNRMARYHEERRRAKGKAPITYEFEAFDKRGRRRIMEVTVAMVPRTDRSTAALRDITKRKKLENELTQMTKELGKLKARISSSATTS